MGSYRYSNFCLLQSPSATSKHGPRNPKKISAALLVIFFRNCYQQVQKSRKKFFVGHPNVEEYGGFKISGDYLFPTMYFLSPKEFFVLTKVSLSFTKIGLSVPESIVLYSISDDYSYTLYCNVYILSFYKDEEIQRH